MRKVLLSAIVACALATVAQAADDMLPTDEVREAAPIGLVGEPWPPGSEQQAQQEQSATLAERFGEWIVTPAGTIPATLLGSVASLGYPTDKFTPVDGDLAKLSLVPPVPHATPGLPFMSAFGDTAKPPFVAADPDKPVASVPLPMPRPAAADSTDSADKAALREEPTTFGGGDLAAIPDEPPRNVK